MYTDMKLKYQQKLRIRQAAIASGCCLLLLTCLFYVRSTSKNEAFAFSWQTASSNELAPELLDNLTLTEAQCETSFPGLFREIHDTVHEGPFTVKQTGDSGPLQGRIKDGKLYIIHAARKRDLSKEMLNSRTSALNQLHRALVTAPEPVPDTIFSLNFQDQPFGTAWAYSRAADPKHRPTDANARSFLMPHFSFWSWPLPFVGSIRRATRGINELEASYVGSRKWLLKDPRAVWRGTAWFNSVHSPQLRQGLIAAAKGKPWADVQTLKWTGGGSSEGREAENALMIEDFCRYRYVIHTEGVTYSGRFQFFQMCASVLITPPLQWMQHTTHLARPLFSSDLDFSSIRARRGDSGSASWAPNAGVRTTWPSHYTVDDANIVFVAPDWSDLEDTITWLEEHPQVAEGIARRQRELFVGGGYFSPAAETCYWRALVKGWASVAMTEDQGWEELEGVPFETFSLTNGP